jgi:hypothetical protein
MLPDIRSRLSTKMFLQYLVCGGCAVIMAVALPSVVLEAQQNSATARDISGFWELAFDGRRVPPASLVASVTPAMAAERAKKDAHAIRWCNMLGLPFLMDSGRPLDIRSGSGMVAIVPEHYTSPRYLYLDRATHVSEEIFDPTTTGDSIARWDGDTLVVDTVGLHDEHGIVSIPGGGYRTATSRLVERYRLVENGNVLSVTFTWTDPNMYRTPHTYEFRYNRLSSDYEPRPWPPCDPYNETRAQFLEGTK